MLPLPPNLSLPPNLGAGPDPSGPPFSPMPPYQPPPPPPQPLPFAPELQQEIAKFSAEWMRSARDYVIRKEPDWLLCRELYEGTIGIREWEDRVRGDGTAREDVGETSEFEDYSDYVHRPAPIIDSWVDQAHSMIFGGPEWCVVRPCGKYADAQVAIDLTKLLSERTEDQDVESRIHDALKQEAIYGTSVVKVAWHFRSDSPRAHIDPLSGQTFDLPTEPWNEGPLVQLVPLDRVLPDWRATHLDCQRWRGIGHRVEKTYDDVILGFDRGVYQLNRDQFEAKYSQQDTGGTPIDEYALTGDEEANVHSDPHGWVQLWEYHGQVSVAAGSYEVIVVIATERDADDPTNGVVLRVSDGPAIAMGSRRYRPFAVDHFHQRPEPFGAGLIDTNRDIIHTLSRLVGMFLDNLKWSLTGGLGVDPTTEAGARIKELGGKIPPGWMPPIEMGTQPFTELPRGNYPTGDNLQAMDVFQRLLEERSITDAARGLAADTRQSATEVNALLQQSQTPTEIKTRLFCKNLLNKALTQCLELIRVFSEGDAVLWESQPSGWQQTIIAEQAMNSPAEYRVYAALTKQDATAQVKASTLQQLFGQVEGLQMMLQSQGMQINLAELVTQFLHFLKLDNIDKLVVPAPPPPPMMGPGPPGPQGQGPPPEVPPGATGTPAGPPTAENQAALQMQMMASQGVE